MASSAPAPAKPTAKPKSTYVETETGNKVARRNQIHGTQHIILGGRTVIQPNVTIRGDLVRPTSSNPAEKKHTPTSITIGRYTFISSYCTLRPPSRIKSGITSYVPMKIGEHVFFGEGCVVEAASIGDRCHFGEGVVVGKLCVIRENVKVLKGAVMPDGMVVPSFCVVGGRPARILGDVGDAWGSGEGEGGDLRELWKATG